MTFPISVVLRRAGIVFATFLCFAMPGASSVEARNVSVGSPQSVPGLIAPVTTFQEFSSGGESLVGVSQSNVIRTYRLVANGENFGVESEQALFPGIDPAITGGRIPFTTFVAGGNMWEGSGYGTDAKEAVLTHGAVGGFMALLHPNVNISSPVVSPGYDSELGDPVWLDSGPRLSRSMTTGRFNTELWDDFAFYASTSHEYPFLNMYEERGQLYIARRNGTGNGFTLHQLAGGERRAVGAYYPNNDDDHVVLATGDLTGNGLDDLVYAGPHLTSGFTDTHFSHARLLIWHNRDGDGWLDGMFDRNPSRAASFTGITDLHIGPISPGGSNYLFVVMGGSGGGVYVALNTTTNYTYGNPQITSNGVTLLQVISHPNAHKMTMGDINRTGRPDIFLTSSDSTNPAWYANQPNQQLASTFSGPRNVGSAEAGAYPHLADLDGDGDLDFIYTTMFGEIRLVANLSPTTGPSLQEVRRRLPSPFSNPINADSITLRMEFDRQAIGLSASDLVVTGDYSPTPVIHSVSAVSGNLLHDVRLDFPPSSQGDGTVGIAFSSSSAANFPHIVDEWGNTIENVVAPTNQQFHVDRQPPTLQSVALHPDTPGASRGGEAGIVLTFSEPMGSPPSGFSNFSFLKNGQSHTQNDASIVDVTRRSGNHAVYDVVVNTGLEPGELSFSVSSPAGILDQAGNQVTNGSLTGKSASLIVVSSPIASYTTTSGPTRGHLELQAHGDTDITLSAAAGNLLINGNLPVGEDGAGINVPIDILQSLTYIGGVSSDEGHDLVDLSGMDMSSFPNLEEIDLDGGSGGANEFTLPTFATPSAAQAARITVTAPAGAAQHLVIPGEGHDVIELDGTRSGFHHEVSASPAVHALRFEGISHLTLGAGDNSLVMLPGAGGFDLVDGGGGSNTLVNAMPEAITAHLGNGTLSRTLGAVSNFQNFTTESGPATITGSSSPNVLTGGPGNDNLSGGAGGNELHATGGDNTLTGGSGDDLLVAGPGDDILAGGDGDDVYRFPANTGGTNVVNESADGGSDTIDLSALSDNQMVTLDTSGIAITGGNGYTITSSGHHVESIEGGSGETTFDVTATGSGGATLSAMGDTTYEVSFTGDLLGDVTIAEAPGGGHDSLTIHGPPSGGSINVGPSNTSHDGRAIVYSQEIEEFSFIGGPESNTIELLPHFTSPLSLDGGSGSGNTLIVDVADPTTLVWIEDDVDPRAGTIQQGDGAVVSYFNIDEVELSDVVQELVVGSITINAEAIMPTGPGVFKASPPATLNGEFSYALGSDLGIDANAETIAGDGHLSLSPVSGLGTVLVSDGAFSIDAASGEVTPGPSSFALSLGGIPVIPSALVIDGEVFDVSGALDHPSFAHTTFGGLRFSANGVTLSDGFFRLGESNDIFLLAPESESYSADTFSWTFETDDIPGTDSFNLSIGAGHGSVGMSGSVHANCNGGNDCLFISLSSPQFLPDGSIHLASTLLHGVEGADVALSDVLISEDAVSIGEGHASVLEMSISFDEAAFTSGGLSAASATLGAGSVVIDLEDFVASRSGVTLGTGSFERSTLSIALTGMAFDLDAGHFVADEAQADTSGGEFIIQGFSLDALGNINATGGLISIGSVTLALLDADFQSSGVTIGHAEVTGLPEESSSAFSFDISDLLVTDSQVQIGEGKLIVAGLEFDLDGGDFSSSGVSFANAGLDVASLSITFADFHASDAGVAFGQGGMTLSSFELTLDDFALDIPGESLEAGEAHLVIPELGQVTIDGLRIAASGHVEATGGSFTAGPVDVALFDPDFQSDHVYASQATLNVDGQGFDVTEIYIDSQGVILDKGVITIATITLDIEEGEFLSSGFRAGKADLNVVDFGEILVEDIAVGDGGFSLGHGMFEFAGLTVDIAAGSPADGGEGLWLSTDLQLPANLLGASVGVTFTVTPSGFDLEGFEFCTPRGTFVSDSNLAMPTICFAYIKEPVEIWEGEGDFRIPGVVNLLAGFRLVEGHLDSITVGVTDINAEIGTTGAFLQDVSATVGNLVRTPRHWSVDVPALGTHSGTGIPPVYVGGSVSATAGPIVAGQALMRGSVDFYADETVTTMDGTVKVLVMDVGGAHVIIRYSKGNEGVEFGGWFTYSYVIQGGGTVYVTMHQGVTGTIYVAIVIPDPVPIVGGYELARVDAGFQSSPLSAWAQFKIIGWKVKMTVSSHGSPSFDTKAMALRPWERSIHAPIYNKDAEEFVTFHGNTFIEHKVYREDSLPAANQPDHPEAETLTIPIAGADPAMIRVHYAAEEGKPVFHLIAPDGSVHQSDEHLLDLQNPGQFAHALSSPGARDATFLLPNPIEGDYQLDILNPHTLDDYTIELLRQVPSPDLEITNVHADGQDLLVEWNVDHPDEYTTVTLMLDPDRRDHRGFPVAGPFPGQQGVHTWSHDLSEGAIPTGSYYVYAVAEDGANAPVRVYYDTPVFVTNPNSPPAVTVLDASIEDGTAVVLFEPIEDDPDIVSYRLDYTSDPTSLAYSHSVAIPVGSNAGFVDGLDDGRNYRFRVVPIRSRAGDDPNAGAKAAVIREAAAPHLASKDSASIRSVPRGELVGEMRARIAAAVAGKAGEGVVNPATIESLAQQAAMTAFHNSRLVERRTPSKHFDDALAEIEDRRARDLHFTARTAKDGGEEPVLDGAGDEEINHYDSFEFTSVTATARTTDGNALPMIHSSPPLVGHVGEEYVYPVVASDADHGELSLSLPGAPPGMSVDADGVITFTPSEAGVYHIVLQVSDGIGTVTQEWDLHIGNVPVHPNLWFATAPVTRADPGASYFYLPFVGGGIPGGTVSIELLEAPAGMSIDETTGALVWDTPPEEDTHRVVILATQHDPAHDFHSQAVQSFHVDVTTSLSQQEFTDPTTGIHDWGAFNRAPGAE